MEGMAFQEPEQAQIKTFNGSMLFHGLIGIVRAGRVKTAASWKQRRDEVLICPDQKE
jgi:hypothetical protein